MRVTRRIEIDAGHRIHGHESKCANLHGHRYAFEVCCECALLDQLGRVIDFGVIKERVGGWLIEHWDHAMILHREDPLDDVLRLSNQKVWSLPTNPTAENLARFVLEKAIQLVDTDLISVVEVTCHETPNCCATATRNDL